MNTEERMALTNLYLKLSKEKNEAAFAVAEAKERLQFAEERFMQAVGAEAALLHLDGEMMRINERQTREAAEKKDPTLREVVESAGLKLDKVEPV